ncbi:MAG: type II toxin-antitoxin system VapC family toxin [Bosea sp. (in: a-proteobacteria)]
MLVDSNVLLDLFTNDPDWASWSREQLERAAARSQLLVNDVIYSEISVRFPSLEAVDDALDRAGIVLAPMPRAALFQAGKACRRYRAAGGSRTGVLPDFFIGAHAMATGLPLLTRDARRYRSYFPAVSLITP